MEHVLALIVRATATYLFLLVLLRMSGKRTVHEGTPLRHHGHDDRRDVRDASIELTGELSVLPTDAARPARRDDLVGGRAA